MPPCVCALARRAPLPVPAELRAQEPADPAWIVQDQERQPSPVRDGDLDTLIIVLADPTAGELAAAYNRTRRGRQRVHVSSIKRALHRQDYVVKKVAAGRRKAKDALGTAPAWMSRLG